MCGWPLLSFDGYKTILPIGASRILEGLMACRGFGEGRMGNGLRMLDAEKN
jgi:hypothetical protein